MKTISLQNKISAHPNSNMGVAIKKAKNFLEDNSTLFIGIALFKGMGLNANVLNYNRIEVSKTEELTARLNSPVIIAEIKD